MTMLRLQIAYKARFQESEVEKVKWKNRVDGHTEKDHNDNNVKGVEL